MGKICRSLFLFVCLSISTVLCEDGEENFKHYEGYQVIRAKLETKEQFDILMNLQHTRVDLDFWDEPRFPGGADIMLSPLQREEILNQLYSAEISYSVFIEDVEAIISKQRENAKSRKNTVEFFEEYQRLNSIYSFLDALKEAYPNLVNISTIGSSTEGRPIKLVKLSTGWTGVRKPSIFIDGAFHSREWISPATVLFMLNELVVNHTQYEDILSGVDFYILPVANPDGYEFSHTDVRLWRRTRSSNGDAPCTGKDLNRNFGYKWGDPNGASDNPCSDIYHGLFPCSEPECQAIVNFILNTKVNWWAYLSFHSAAQMWLTPWGFTAEVPYDHSDMMAMGNRAVDALTKVYGTPYEVGPSSTTIYFTSGTSQDWARGIAGIKYSVTVELRSIQYSFLLPPEFIIPSGIETFESLKVVAREVIRQNACSNMAPVSLTSTYTPQGDITIVNGMETYETRDKKPKTLLIGVYDIYGFSPSTNIWQICDKFAESGVRVVLPDFFRGEPWKREHYPPPTDQEYYDFVKRATSWEESVRADLIEVISHYKKEGVESFGIFGFCFGGGIVARATMEFFEDLKVGAHFHPSSINITHASLIRSPTILLPGANDADMTEYCRLINENNGAGSCEYTHFRDVNHGYAGGRADWTNSTIRGRAEEAVSLARNFFCEKLK